MHIYWFKKIFIGLIFVLILGGCVNNISNQKGDFICSGISYLKTPSEKQLPLNAILIKRFQTSTDSFHFAVPLNKYYVGLKNETFIGIPVITAKTAQNLKLSGFNRIFIDTVSCLFKCTRSEKTDYKFCKQYIFNNDKSCIYILKNDADSLPNSLPILIQNHVK